MFSSIRQATAARNSKKKDKQGAASSSYIVNDYHNLKDVMHTTTVLTSSNTGDVYQGKDANRENGVGSLKSLRRRYH